MQYVLGDPAKMGKMPVQTPGKSYQEYITPTIFINSVYKLLGITDFAWDLAADKYNTQSPFGFYGIEDNSLTKTWADGDGLANQWLWLNPPFTKITPWAKKCWEESQNGANIALLVPASVGANWYRDWVHDKAYVLYLNGRLAFIPEQPNWLYPKDLMLVLYNTWAIGSKIWTWHK